jgi:putative sterol carrier protein
MGEIREHPILSKFAEPLPKLIEADTEDVSRGISRFGELLGSRTEPLSIGFHLTGDGERYLRLLVDPQGAHLSEARADEQPDLEIIASEQAWRSIAAGAESPLSVMAAGRLRFRGNVLLASRVVHELRRASAARNEEK